MYSICIQQNLIDLFNMLNFNMLDFKNEISKNLGIN